MPYLTKNSLILYHLGGTNNAKTFDPSSGGIGIKLNTASTTLVFINITRNVTNKLFSGDTIKLNANNIFNIKANTNAEHILDNIPAKLVIYRCDFKFFLSNLLTSIITGFPQPTPNNINVINPTGSKCLRGFKLNLLFVN